MLTVSILIDIVHSLMRFVLDTIHYTSDFIHHFQTLACCVRQHHMTSRGWFAPGPYATERKKMEEEA
jgi:hypothetical protein